MTPSFEGTLPEGATPLDPNETAGLRLKHITTLKELDEAESACIAKAQLWLLKQRKAEVLSVPFLLKLHTQMFGEVWKWAGTYRVSDKNIGVPWMNVPQAVAELLHKAEDWRRTERFSWDEWGARFHHRLVEIHPFPNGNGRHARLMTDVALTRLRVPPFTWGGVGTTSSAIRSEYIAALREADSRNFARLIAFVRS